LRKKGAVAKCRIPASSKSTRKAAGIVLRETDGYRYFAATHRFNALECQTFASANDYKLAVTTPFAQLFGSLPA
jgi:hypothetical protein